MGWLGGGDPMMCRYPATITAGMTDVAVYRKDTGAWSIISVGLDLPYAVGLTVILMCLVAI